MWRSLPATQRASMSVASPATDAPWRGEHSVAESPSRSSAWCSATARRPAKQVGALKDLPMKVHELCPYDSSVSHYYSSASAAW